MASIRQTIPAYTGGISEQPDQLKKLGQVKNSINAYPDIIRGLYKRPGSKRVGTNPLVNIQSGGTWFHYHRDAEEGSYVGQIAADGTPRIWKAEGDNAGAAQVIAYGTGGETAIKNYLSTTDPENIQTLTINDTTFITNRDTNVATSGTTDARPDTHFAYIDLLRTENGRQYALNIYSNNTASVAVKRATRLKITDENLAEGDGTGHCPGVGTQVFAVTASSDYTGTDIVSVKNSSGTDITTGKENLIFRLTTLGQQGNSNQDDEVSDAGGFRCTYDRRIELLHGGEGWETGDVVRVNLSTAQTTYWYDVTVDKAESTTVKADVALVRPDPTPFDAETSVTVDTILGGIIAELNSTGITATVIGNGLYLTKSSSFNVEVVDKDLMRSMQDSVNNVTDLPIQCKHGYIVKIANSRMSDEDDYYVKFEGANDRDGPGAWVECPAPGIVKGFDDATMPHVIQRTSIANAGTVNEVATFTVKQFDYSDREVGDNLTNPIPRFNGNPINQVLFFRNRIVFLSKQYVICSRPGTADKPNFWAETALTTGATDPIDIASSSTFPSALFNGIETNTGLVLFSSNHQFLFSSDDTVMNPDTAKVKSISVYNCNTDIPPVSLGTSTGFIDNSGKYSRFNEMFQVRREGEPEVMPTSAAVSTLLEKDIDLITNSRENGVVLFGKTNSKTVIGYRYLNQGKDRPLSAWFKWEFNQPLLYHFIVNDTYYYIDGDHFLHSMNLVQGDADISIDQDNINYQLHLDNYITVGSGSYDAATKKTTFTGQTAWLQYITSTTNKLVLVDSDSNTAREGRYVECTVDGQNFTVPGDWSGSTVNIGYLYDYQVDIPTIYVTRQEGKFTSADINAALTVHRVKLSFGKVGLYETTLTRVGKSAYNEVYESSVLDNYEVSDAPYLEEAVRTVPVYEKNTNVDITIKSTHPSPATLRAMTWEGDYSPKYYRSV